LLYFFFKAVALAKKTGARLHVFICLLPRKWVCLRTKSPWKKITAEVCIHHLWFTNEDYARESYKMEPNRKNGQRSKILWEALLDGRIDVIATDHALIH
jgi:dihydroorotase